MDTCSVRGDTVSQTNVLSFHLPEKCHISARIGGSTAPPPDPPSRTPMSLTHSLTHSSTHSLAHSLARTHTYTHRFNEHLWLVWLRARKTYTFSTVPMYPVSCPNLPLHGVGWDSSITCRWHLILLQWMKGQHNLVIMFVEEGFPFLVVSIRNLYRKYFRRYLRKSEKCPNQPQSPL